jgi:hypothetical protein
LDDCADKAATMKSKAKSIRAPVASLQKKMETLVVPTAARGQVLIMKILVQTLLCATLLATTAEASMAPPNPIQSHLTMVAGCPRGYDYDTRTGQCFPNRSGGHQRHEGPQRHRSSPRYYHERSNYRGYYDGGYGCPYGTNPLPNGECVPAGGASCPPGYNALYGRCYPAN